MMTESSGMGGVGGTFEKEGISVYIQRIHVVVQQKVTHYKAVTHQ